MLIAGYLRTTLLDYPGKVAAEIWTGGCNYNCPFCHNRDLIIYKGAGIPAEEIVQDLKARKAWIDALVIGGGEPTLQHDLPHFCQQIKKLNLHIKLDTNGSNPKIIKELIAKKLIDCIAMDIKSAQSSYNVSAGKQISISNVQESIQTILQAKIDHEFRTTVVPILHTKEKLLEIAEYLAGVAKDTGDYPKWVLQNFRPGSCNDIAYNSIVPYNRDELLTILNFIKEKHPFVSLRGM